jgi:hypothetical protein
MHHSAFFQHLLYAAFLDSGRSDVSMFAIG